jgi:hypothetical protein
MPTTAAVITVLALVNQPTLDHLAFSFTGARQQC